MASDLSPNEKEEREVERLINKEPAPSRKHTERRGPKHDNRRRRMKVDDPDLKKTDRDMSLNRKTQGSLSDIAWRILTSASLNELETLINKFVNIVQRKSPKLAKDFIQYIENTVMSNPEFDENNNFSLEVQDMKKTLNDFRKSRKHLMTVFSSADKDSVPSLVIENWPKDKNNFALKAAVIYALDRAIDDIPIPQSYKIPFLRGDVKDNLSDDNLLRKLIESASKRHTFKGVGEDIIILFAELASAYRIVQSNPSDIDSGELTKNINELSVKLQEQARELIQLGSILEAWNYSADSLKTVKKGDRLTFEKSIDFDKATRSLNEFFSNHKELMDPIPLMKELGEITKKRFGEIPPELEGSIEGFNRAATSNESSFSGNMTKKVAQFHGVDDRRGNPVSPPNTPYKSFDSRNFTEDNYKAILAYAEALLDQPWLKYGWDGSSQDAQYRAALDLAIHVADDCLYQNKIDTDTYNLLYARLANLKVDTFSETIIPVQNKVGQKRRAAIMKQSREYQNIVRIASDLRGTDPQAAFDIMKNIRGLVATDADPSQTISQFASDDMEEEESDDTTASVAPTSTDAGDMIEFRSLGDDDFSKLKEEIKKETDKLFNESDVESFLSGFDNIVSDIEKKTASLLGNRVPLALLIKLASQNEAVRVALQPVFIAAKKKQDKTSKKQDKKTSKKKVSKKKVSKKPAKKDDKPKGKKAPPFGGKQAPPFGKGKKARQSSITKEDFTW